jgi:hypothetical protein
LWRSLATLAIASAIGVFCRWERSPETDGDEPKMHDIAQLGYAEACEAMANVLPQHGSSQ